MGVFGGALVLRAGVGSGAKPTGLIIGLLARTEIIDRLRRLNRQACADEVHLGLHEKPAKHPDMPKPSADAIRKRKEQLAARGGSDFGEGAEGALF
ncbi:hypothetical protein [Streptomyces atratus]|uniref:hypothetical protein n=1 Tax=Streptomyces atratus TaxID=1893 RepID=UPI00366844F0